jgi:hypothetical protein
LRAASVAGAIRLVGPAQQRRVVGHPLEINTAELAQHQAIADEVLDLLVAPAVQALDHEQAQDDLDRRARPASRQAVRRAARQVGLDPAEDLIVVEQAIELAQHRLEVGHELRHQREQRHRRVAIDEHGGAVSPGRGAPIPPS